MNSLDIIVLILVMEVAAYARAYRKHNSNPNKSFMKHFLIANALYGFLTFVILIVNFTSIEAVLYEVASENKSTFLNLFDKHSDTIMHVVFNATFLIIALFAVIEITRNILSTMYFPSKRT